MPTTGQSTVHTPTVSVIIPCFNLGRYLSDAIDSVHAQSYTDVEIIVVDDGSTDDETRRVLAGYGHSGSPGLQVVTSHNRGLPGAKNLGLEHASGRYVCMLDADDRLGPGFMEKSVATLEGNPGVAFVSHWFRTFGDEEWEWTPSSCELPTLLDKNTVNGAALVRRSALDAVGGFDETMRDGCEDWDVWISLVERGFAGTILPEVLFHYRRRPDSMSRVMMEGDRHPRIFRRLVEKHANSYRAHLPSLLVRRERDLSHLRRHVGALELDFERELAPELTKVRDDVEMLKRRAMHVESAREVTRARAEVDALRSSLSSAQAESEHRVARVRAEVDALRSSLSWRLTAPLRMLYDLIRPPRGC